MIGFVIISVEWSNLHSHPLFLYCSYSKMISLSISKWYMNIIQALCSTVMFAKKWPVNTSIPYFSGLTIAALYVVVLCLSVWCVFEKFDGICLYIKCPNETMYMQLKQCDKLVAASDTWSVWGYLTYRMTGRANIPLQQVRFGNGWVVMNAILTFVHPI